MPTFIILTVLSFTFYVFYKIKSVRTNRPYEKRWINSKASVALGSFLFFFGLNRLFVDQSTIIVIICLVFLAIGGLYAYNGVKAYRHLRPFAAEEAAKENH